MIKYKYDTLSLDMDWSAGEYTGTGNCALNEVLELRIHGGKIYVLNNGGNRLFRLDLTTAACDWDIEINDPRAMDIQNDILYAFGDNMKIYDLSSSTPTQVTGCKYKNNLKSYFLY